MSPFSNFLAGCMTMAAAIAVVTLLSGARQPSHAHFDEITVGRINIVEPDGSKRIVISNRSQFPGDFYRGKETARPDRKDSAGMIFVNDEGTENGGFLQSGMEQKDGSIQASLSLTFDRFRQDQALQLFHTDNEINSTSSIRINDVPNYRISSIEDLRSVATNFQKMSPEEQSNYQKKLIDEGRILSNRVYLGTTNSKDSTLSLKDEKGRPRMVLSVSAAGQPEIRMLDENGKVVKIVNANN